MEIRIVLDVIPCRLISSYNLGLLGPEDKGTMIV